SVGGTALGAANAIGGAGFAGTFGPFTNTGSGDVVLNDTAALAVGPVSNIVGNIRLSTADALDLAGSLTAAPAGTITLIAAGIGAHGGIKQTAGAITAGSLFVSAAASVDLPGSNAIGTLAANVSGGGCFAFA